VTGVADDVGPGGAAAATDRGGGLALGDEPGVGEVLEVAADRRGGEPEVVGEGRGGDGSTLADGLEDPLAGARLEHGRTRDHRGLGARRDIHNIDVT
jgi:hypothetical protein